jgi:hypothetical protein
MNTESTGRTGIETGDATDQPTGWGAGRPVPGTARSHQSPSKAGNQVSFLYSTAACIGHRVTGSQSAAEGSGMVGAGRRIANVDTSTRSRAGALLPRVTFP